MLIEFIAYITEVKPGKIKVACSHAAEWIEYDNNPEVEKWISQGYEEREWRYE